MFKKKKIKKRGKGCPTKGLTSRPTLYDLTSDRVTDKRGKGRQGRFSAESAEHTASSTRHPPLPNLGIGRCYMKVPDTAHQTGATRVWGDLVMDYVFS